MVVGGAGGRAAAWLLAGSAAALCLSHGVGTQPLMADNQHYFFMAERAASGVPPYVSNLDPVSALSVLAEAGGIALGRLAGVDDMAAARLVSVAFFAAAVLLAFRLAGALTGSTVAAVVSALTMLSLTPLLRQAAMSGQPKVALVTFTLAALLADRRGRPGQAGFMAGLAFLCYQPALLLVAALLAAGFARDRRVGTAARLVAAFVVPVLAYEAYFLATGALAAQWKANYVLPFVYLRGAWHDWPYYQGTLTMWFNAYGAASAVPLLAIAAAVAQWRTWLRGGGVRTAAASGWLAVHLGGLGMLAYHVYDHQGVPDTFRPLAFMVPLAAAAVAAGIERARRVAAAAGTAAAVVVLAVLLGLPASGRLGYRAQPTLASQRGLAEEVGVLLAQGAGVWALGCTHLLAFNHASNWLPIGFSYRGLARFLEAESGRREFSPERDGRWPGFILVSRGGFPQGEQGWLRDRYAPVESETFGRWKIRVFRLRQGLGASAR